MNLIPEVDQLSAEEFHNEVLPAAKPLVIRGLVKHWPIVQAAQRGREALCQYLLRFDTGSEVGTAMGPPSIKGRIFYNTDLSGFNCRMGESRLATSLDYLLKHAEDDPAPTLAIQSAPIPNCLPGLERENPLGLLSEQVSPRIWIGGRTTIAAHYDSSENIACCVAGKRRFTLFPPEQVANLYPGPFELTPAGATISMVDFDAPDYRLFPRFKWAEEEALIADLLPGDAVFIPYLWWHHVRALEALNVLVNYWWGEVDSQHGDPRVALFFAMMAVRDLPPSRRAAWLAHFNHYVFQQNGEVAEHLPESRRGIMGNLSKDMLRKLRQSLSRALSPL